MTRLPTVGGDEGNWGNILNDYLSQSHASDGTLRTQVVGAPQLQQNSVTTAALAPGAVSASAIQDGSITTSKLQDGAVTGTKLAALGQPGGIATLDTTGKLSSAQVPATADATATTKGAVQLAGDLGGTSDSPTVPGLTVKQDKASLDADVAAKISDGASASRTALNAAYAPANPALTVNYNPDGTVASTVEDGVTTSYTYNADGTVATATRAGVTRTFTYSNGNVTGAA